MRLAQIIQGVSKLISLPEVVIKLNELIESDSAGSEELGALVAHDPALSARLLKLVNSAMYQFPGQINTVSRALTMVGTDSLRSLAIASSVGASFKKIDPSVIDMNAFWTRSIYCGLVASKLARATGDRSAETAFVQGLLHDVGRLVLAMKMPDELHDMLEKAATQGCSLAVVEEAELGFNSAEISAALLQSWRLPEDIWAPIRYLHSPSEAGSYAVKASLLALAQMASLSYEHEDGTTEQAVLDEEQVAPLLSAVGVDSDVFQGVLTESNLEFFGVFSILSPTAGTIY